jgi:UPF0755 protein
MKSLRAVCALLLIGAAAGGYGFYRLSRRYSCFDGETFVEIPRGTAAGGIGALLEESGVIASRRDFLLARILQRGRTLQAGEYRFVSPASVLDVYDRIARGDTFYYELVVPEGKNMFDIAQRAEELGLFPAAKFVAAARKPAMIRDLDPHAPTLEGYLYPNTYRLMHTTTPEKLCRIMTGKFREVWYGLGLNADVHETITLASLVEREGKLPDERPVIAAVFSNRLRIGMKLDCDPTTIYAALLQDRYRGSIYKSDLESDDPYNTYRHAGLPPGPIANPGLASIKAALRPAVSDALYFVARPDGSGGHTFHHDIAGHREAVARYRRGQHR